MRRGVQHLVRSQLRYSDVGQLGHRSQAKDSGCANVSYPLPTIQREEDLMEWNRSVTTSMIEFVVISSKLCGCVVLIQFNFFSCDTN